MVASLFVILNNDQSYPFVTLFLNYQVRHSLIGYKVVTGMGKLQVEKPGSISSASRPAMGKSP